MQHFDLEMNEIPLPQGIVAFLQVLDTNKHAAAEEASALAMNSEGTKPISISIALKIQWPS